MTEPWGYDTVRVRANGNVAYDSFNGDIEFNVNNNESERWISPKIRRRTMTFLATPMSI